MIAIIGLIRFLLIAQALYVAIAWGLPGVLLGAVILTLMTPPIRYK